MAAKIDFFVSEAEKRLLNQFPDIEGEAEAFAEQEFERLGTILDPERFDLADAAEMAHDRSLERYQLLSDMQRDIILTLATALYHDWEKELREWLVRELAHNFDMTKLEPRLWAINITELLDFLKALGWDPRLLSDFRHVEDCRLVVNVFKHGLGRSFEELKANAPQFLKSDFLSEAQFLKYADHRSISISLEDLRDFQRGLKQFWLELPENIFWSDNIVAPTWFEKALAKKP
ncbi:hypothetical protein NOJ05_19555 [Neorhizobium galegae]|uniref:hypothetical protein n=1 Tax=Neorhizobium galegae TaxID=399 RepID=UPI002105765C|nr:hypothetical protein [Neorhizobium galegae]MCQ1779408.1 hypothetical protein [Neorhizobium galegae]MCQ1795568.1 hypothetical protein [Neorhizobium galegae]